MRTMRVEHLSSLGVLLDGPPGTKAEWADVRSLLQQAQDVVLVIHNLHGEGSRWEKLLQELAQKVPLDHALLPLDCWSEQLPKDRDSQPHAALLDEPDADGEILPRHAPEKDNWDDPEKQFYYVYLDQEDTESVYDEKQFIFDLVHNLLNQNGINRQEWGPRHLVLWSNAGLLQAATSFDPTRYERLLHRTQPGPPHAPCRLETVRRSYLRRTRRGLATSLPPLTLTTERPSDDDDLSYLDYSSQPPVEIRHSCMLLPIFVAVWWYWTRRAARRAVRVLIPGDGCLSDTGDQESVDGSHMSGMEGDSHIPPGSHRDKFGSWSDVVEQQSSSLHLVRWISNSKERQAKQRVRAVSKSVMNRSSEPNGKSTHHDYVNVDDSLDCDGMISVNDALSTSGCTNWECIDDTAIEVPAPRALADDVSHDGVFA